MSSPDAIIAELCNVVNAAIAAGDWKLDGACDPDAAMYAAEHFLQCTGWERNSVDGYWQPGSNRRGT